MVTKISDTQLTLRGTGVGTQKWLHVDYTGKVFQNWRHSSI